MAIGHDDTPPVETYQVLRGKGKRKDRAIAAKTNDGKGDRLRPKMSRVLRRRRKKGRLTAKVR